jgi:hypothetical protein
MEDKNSKAAVEQWFYDAIRKFPVPAGTESKFANTEAFFTKIINSAHWSTFESTAADPEDTKNKKTKKRKR